MSNPLFVADSSREFRKRATEASVEKDFMWSLEQLKLMNRHFYDRFAGVPDRYIAGGNWLEFKSIAYVNYVNVFRHLEVEQRRNLAAFHNGGDRSFGIAMLCSEHERRLLIAPWPSLLKCERVSFKWASEHLPEIKDKHDMLLAVSKWFHPRFDRNSRYDDLPL